MPIYFLRYKNLAQMMKWLAQVHMVSKQQNWNLTVCHEVLALNHYIHL